MKDLTGTPTSEHFKNCIKEMKVLYLAITWALIILVDQKRELLNCEFFYWGFFLSFQACAINQNEKYKSALVSVEYSRPHPDLQCYSFNWDFSSENAHIRDCFTGGHLFTSNLFTQPRQSLLLSDLEFNETQPGKVMSSFWQWSLDTWVCFVFKHPIL